MKTLKLVERIQRKKKHAPGQDAFLRFVVQCAAPHVSESFEGTKKL